MTHCFLCKNHLSLHVAHCPFFSVKIVNPNNNGWRFVINNEHFILYENGRLFMDSLFNYQYLTTIPPDRLDNPLSFINLYLTFL